MAQWLHSSPSSPPLSSSLVPVRQVSGVPPLQGVGEVAPGNSYVVWASGGCDKGGIAAAPQI